MHTKLYAAAGLMIATGTAANAAAPKICENLATQAAQVLDQKYTDSSFSDPYNPKTLTLKSKSSVLVTETKDPGTSDENSKLPAAFCQVAGGVPAVHELQVSKKGEKKPFAKVTVTFNRGACFVDAVERLD